MAAERIDYNNLGKDPEYRDFDRIHSAGFDNIEVNVRTLHEETENHPVVQTKLSEWLHQLDHACWETDAGAKTAPRALAEAILALGYDGAKKQLPDFAKDIRKIKNADYTYPIHIYHNKEKHQKTVVDGSHRLAHLYIKEKLDQNPSGLVNAKIITTIPEKAIIKK